MQGPDPSRAPERSAATGAWPSAGGVRPSAADGSPTVRSGGGGGGPAGRARAAAGALPEPGDRLEFFELERAIGAGGMGAVFLALDVRLDRYVALKVLPPEQAADPEVVQRFYQEARAAARLDHENIARVFTIGHDKAYHFIAFEFVEGATLREQVERDGPLAVPGAIDATLQIAGALVHASGRGVVHRDIKPSNIIVTPSGRAKLVDMGLARRFERGGGGDDGLTQSGMTLGTFDYISPEQARDPRDVDVRSDLYSLGCTLYHMLTGRPPFPEGTVLQKLLQHQADEPPDVRSLNPAVPAELAAIVTKLMAKDRDRRHQTPDQLARDLLTVAGALGLRPDRPEALSWAPAGPPPAWQRHLTWALPAAALGLIVLAVGWYGREPAPPEGGFVVEPAPPAAPPPRPNRPAPAAAVAESPTAPRPRPAPPRDLILKAGDDLARALAEAPSGSTLTLAEAGPYDLRPAPAGAPADRPPRRDLTIKAGPGARPVLRSAGGRPALLDFGGGKVEVEGIEFAPEPTGRGGPAAAIRARDTELTLRSCTFRRRGPARADPKAGPALAVDLRSTARPDAEGAAGAGPGLTTILACAFGPGQAGVSARGPVKVSILDTTFGAADPAIAGADGDTPLSVLGTPAQFLLRHVSILAGEGPAFRFEGAAPVVRLDECVVAPAGLGEVTLIAADEPDRLDWRGVKNLYGRVGTYLQPAMDRPGGRLPIWDYPTWADDATGPRESGSMPTDAHVWAAADPLPALDRAGQSPARALRLAAIDRPDRHSGARRGPDGPLPPAGPPAPVALAMGPPRPDPDPDPDPVAAPRRTPPKPADPAPRAVAPADPRPPQPAPPPVEAMPPEVDPMGPMERLGEEDDPPARPTDPPRPRPAPMATEAGTRPVAASPAPTPAPAAESDPVRTAAEFKDALRRLAPGGGTIRLAAGVELTLPTCDLRAGRWVIEADPGGPRPRLGFRPAPADPPAATSWAYLFRLRSGSLVLRGVDVVADRDDVADRGHWAAFAVAAGTDLELANCTATALGDPEHSVLIAVPAGEEPGGMAVAAAAIRLTESLLRGSGDLVDVAAGRRLDLEAADVALGAGGCLVRGHGLPRNQVAEPLKVTLRRATARLAGGLVRLDSAPAEPELPLAEVTAWDLVVAGIPRGAPLVQVGGQDGLEALRDRVRWEGHSVAYSGIEVYRRDQTAQLGTIPIRYDRPSWEVAVGPHEDAATHDKVKFEREWAPDRTPWTLTRDDVRLAPDSPVTKAGADPARLPVAPAEATR